MLARSGGSWDLIDERWRITALHMAAWRGHSELVEKLLEVSATQVHMNDIYVHVDMGYSMCSYL